VDVDRRRFDRRLPRESRQVATTEGGSLLLQEKSDVESLSALRILQTVKLGDASQVRVFPWIVRVPVMAEVDLPVAFDASEEREKAEAVGHEVVPLPALEQEKMARFVGERADSRLDERADERHEDGVEPP